MGWHQYLDLVCGSSHISSPDEGGGWGVGQQKDMLVAGISRCGLNVAARFRPYLLSSEAGTGADTTQVLLLPLVSHLVSFSIIVAHRIICFTRETYSFSHLCICQFRKKDGGGWAGAGESGLTWFTLELSFALSQTSATHQVTVFSLAVPFFPDPVVDSVVMAPF